MSISKETLNKNLKSIFGFNSFRADQEDIILNLLERKDSMVIMPTGGGKSMCYQLPALIPQLHSLLILMLVIDNTLIFHHPLATKLQCLYFQSPD